MDSKIASLYKNTSIALAFLCSSSLLIDETAYRLGINLSHLHWGIFLNLGFIAALSFNFKNFSNLQQKLIVTLIVMILFIFLVGLFRDFKSVFHIGRELITGIFFFSIIADRKFVLQRLSKFIIFIGFIFSIFSIILYFGYYTGIIGLKAVIIHKGQIYYEGFGGYLNYASQADVVKYGSILRSQSYWTEAARFAQFLEVPLFISLQKAIGKKSLYHTAICSTIALALLLTFSVANFTGIFVAFVCYIALCQIKLGGYKTVARLFKIIALAGCILSFLWLWSAVISEDKSTKKSQADVLYKGYDSVQLRIDRLKTAVGVLDSHLFGSQSYAREHVETFGNPSMIGSAIVIGGIPIVILLFYMYVNFFRQIINKLRKSKYGIAYMGSIAYFVANMVYGHFYESYSLFQFALFTAYMKHDEEDHLI